MKNRMLLPLVLALILLGLSLGIGSSKPAYPAPNRPMQPVSRVNGVNGWIDAPPAALAGVREYGAYRFADADWRSGGPRGGPALTIALSPEFASDGLVLAGGGQWLSGRGDRFGKGLFRSDDGGQTWAASGETTFTGYASSIEDADISTHWPDDGTAFVGTWGGLFRTTDWGANWQRVAEGVFYNPGAVTAVALSPGFYLDGIVLAGGGYGNLYYTEDGGDSWQRSLEIGPVSDIAYSPTFTEDGTAFVSAWGGVWRTQDRAAHWSHVLDLESGSVSDVEVSCEFPTDHTIYAATRSGEEPPYLMRSTDGGETWHIADTGLDRPVNVMATACDGGGSTGLTAGGTTLFAGGTALFRSTDGGETWTILPGWPQGVSIQDLALSPQYATDHTLLAGTYSGVYRSTDGGETWTLSQGFVPLETRVVVPSPAYAQDGTLFAGTEMGVYKSTDRGQNWQPANKGLVDSFASFIRDIVLSPDFANDRTLFASKNMRGRIGGNLYRSADAGENWERLWGTGYVGDLAISPEFPSDQTLFVVAEGIVLKSTDGGESLVPKLFELMPTMEIGISPEYGTDQTVYAVGYGPMYRSTDGGETWQPLSGASPNYGVGLSPAFGDDRTLFASYREIEPSGIQPESGVIRSTDGGDHWELATTGLPGTYEPWPQSLALSPHFAADRMLFTALSGIPHLGPNQVYASISAGEAWASLPLIPGEPSLYKLAASSEPDGRVTLHAGTSAGAWHYSSACFDTIANGGFEFDAGWTMPITPYPADYSLDLAHSGHRSLRTGIPPGGPNVTSYSSAYQTVTIPAGVASATLRFWEYPLSGEAATPRLPAGVNPLDVPLVRDVQYLLVLDAQGHWLRTLLWQASDARQWTYHQFDLADLAGQTIRLHFGTYNNGTGGLTAMYVDDVSLEICPHLPPVPTDTPTPMPVLDRFLYLPLLLKHHAPPTPTPTATPTAGPTPTPTATATPGGECTEAVNNGGFETDAAWIMPVTPMQAGYSTYVAHGGSRSLRTGIPEGGGNILSYSAAYQTITLPPGPGTATLTFWYYPVSGDAAASSALLPYAGYAILKARYPGLALPSSGSGPAAVDRQYALLRDGHGTWHLLLWTLSDARTWLRYEADLSAYMGQTVQLHFETFNDGLGGTTAMYVDDVSIQVCPEPTPTPPTDALVINGQWVHGLVGHRASATLYAYDDLNLYRSDDAGASWRAVGDSVGEFLMSPADPDVLYRGAGYPCLAGGPDVPMYKSTDGGQTWFELPAGLNLKVLAVHLTDPGRVYAAGCDGPYLSSDGGASWTHQPDLLWGIYEVKHIAPVEPDWQMVYAAGVSEGGGGAVIKSTDGGATWQQVTPLDPSPEIWWITDLLVDPADPLVVRFTEPHTPWWSRDGGASWSWSWTGLHDVVYDPGGPPDQTYGLYDLELDIADHEQLYLGTIRGLYVSGDGGGNWYKVTGGHSWEDAPLGKLLLLEAAPTKLYLVRREEQGVHVYDLGGLPPIPTATPTNTPTYTPTPTSTATPTATPTPTATATPALPCVLATIPLPSDSHPHGVALDPDGNPS